MQILATFGICQLAIETLVCQRHEFVDIQQIGSRSAIDAGTVETAPIRAEGHIADSAVVNLRGYQLLPAILIPDFKSAIVFVGCPGDTLKGQVGWKLV